MAPRSSVIRALSTIFFILSLSAKGIAFDEANRGLLELIRFETLLKDLHPFQTDCENALRDPKIKWDQVETAVFYEQAIVQIKLSGRIMEDLGLRFWSRRILLYDGDQKPLPAVIVPVINVPSDKESGEFVLTITVPRKAHHVSIPLEFYGNDSFRYLITLRNIYGEMKAVAKPAFTLNSNDFCNRPIIWVGAGLAASAQKQTTSPVVTDLDMASFKFDRLQYEQKWIYGRDRNLRLNFLTQTFDFSNLLNASGSYRIMNLSADMGFTQRPWGFSNKLFKVQYGYLLGVEYEQRPFAVVESASSAAISLGQHLALSAGGYAELFSRNNEWYTETTLKIQPIFQGLNHTYSGVGLVGSLGIARPLSNRKALGVYTGLKYFSGSHKGSSNEKDNSTVNLLETNLEVRYGWLF